MTCPFCRKSYSWTHMMRYIPGYGFSRTVDDIQYCPDCNYYPDQSGFYPSG